MVSALPHDPLPATAMLPTFDGDTVASIEGDCTFHHAGVTTAFVDEEFSALDPLMSTWIGQALTSVDDGTSGDLVVHCAGDRLVVPASDEFEAWGIAGPLQERSCRYPVAR